MFCTQCGSNLPEGTAFCIICGAKQDVTQPTTPVAPVQPEEPVFEEFDKTVGMFTSVPPVQTAPPQTPVQPEPSVDDFDKTVGMFTSVPPVQTATPQTPAQQEPSVNDFDKTVGMFNAVPPVQPVAPTGAQPPYNQAEAQPHNTDSTFGESVTLFFKNYANFSGRCSKSEFTWAFLFSILMNLGCTGLTAVLPPVGAVLALAMLIPSLSLTIRRLHDTGKSGWFTFICLIPLVGWILLLLQYFQDSEGDNRWGPGPKVR